MADDLNGRWLVGANGVYAGDGTDAGWRRIGRFDFYVTCMLRAGPGAGILAGVNCGLWRIDPASGGWLQLHDETLTEVQAVAAQHSDDRRNGRGALPSVLAGSPYGLALAVGDPTGPTRWRFCSDSLRIGERFTNAILAGAGPLGAAGTLLVGTEAGVLLAHGYGQEWERTSLSRYPVRALLFAHECYWAGSDGAGIWTSADGRRWDRAGQGIDDATVFDLAATGDAVIAASTVGFLRGSGGGGARDGGGWRRVGPRVRATCVAVHPTVPGLWLGGSHPGGLWRTEDGGSSWRQSGSWTRVDALLSPVSEAES